MSSETKMQPEVLNGLTIRAAMLRSRLFASSDLPHLEAVGRSAMSRENTPYKQGKDAPVATNTPYQARRFAIQLAAMTNPKDGRKDQAIPFESDWVKRPAG